MNKMLSIITILLINLLCINVILGNKEVSLFSIYDPTRNKSINTTAHIPHFEDNSWKLKRPVFDKNLHITSTDIDKNALAQLGEDKYLFRNLFYNMKNGIILESGALNGITYSTTYLFEHLLDWKCIHVEADPVNYNQLVSNRPKSFNIHTALCSDNNIIHWTLDLQGGAVNGIYEFMPQRLKDVFHPKLATTPFDSPLFLPLTCVPLKLLLKKLDITHIDIWILDVEGGELSILNGMDFNEISVSVIIIECDGWNIEQDNLKLELLKKNKFTCTKLDRANYACLHESFKPSTA